MRTEWLTAILSGYRSLWAVKKFKSGAEFSDPENTPVLVHTQEQANLIGSKAQFGDLHYPVLDLDYDADLIPSSTPGHFHLYLNKGVTWDKYLKVLGALADAGLIQEGYAKYSIARGQCFVRKPGVFKQPGDASSSEFKEETSAAAS